LPLGSRYAAFAVLLRFGLILLLAWCASGCQRKESKRSFRAAPARIVKRTPRQVPPEPPFGPLEVPDAGFPCDVEAALKAKCRRCHTIPARHGAPFPLLTWEQTQDDYHGTPIVRHMARAVKSGFMPYRINANPPIEPLTDDEKQAIVSWAEAGGPRAACPPVTTKKTGAPRSKARPKASL